MAFFLDDAVGAVAGGAIAVGLEVGKDVVTGEKVTGGSLFGAFVGGVLLGEGVVNAPETLGGSLILAGAAKGAAVGFVSNSVQQLTDTQSGAQNSYNLDSAATSMAMGAVTEGISTKLPTARVPGITSGRNNMAAVAKGVRTKIANGRPQRMSARTAVKGATGSQVGKIVSTAVGATMDMVQTSICSNFLLFRK